MSDRFLGPASRNGYDTIDNNKLLIQRMHDDVTLPSRAHSSDAGLDLHAYTSDHFDFVIQPGYRVLIGTGCRFSIPKGYYGRIADRSGNAWKSGLHVLGGVVDSGYSGEVKVILQNLSGEEYIVRHNDKIAQLIIEKIYEGEILEVNDLDQTERNDKGFGSSGK